MSPKDFGPFAWPLAIFVIVFSFYSPLYDAVESLAVRLGGISHLKIGELEIVIDPAKLPLPDSTITAAIRDLDRDGLLQLLELEPSGPAGEDSGGYCFHDTEDDIRMMKLRELEAAGLVAMTAEDEEEDWCPNPHSVGLTNDGQEVKDFALDLLAAQLTR